MSDLVSGRYPQQAPAWSQFGQQNNLAQPSVPMFHNAPATSAIENGAPIITKEETVVPVNVPWGVSIEKISLVNGATETETLTHAWACLRTGESVAAGKKLKATVVGTSTDKTTFEAKKTETVSFTLEKPVLITPENAPGGFIYVGVYMVATKVGTYASFKTAATALTKASSGTEIFPWFTGAPVAFKTKPTTETKPETEIKEAVLVEVAPVLFLQ